MLAQRRRVTTGKTKRRLAVKKQTDLPIALFPGRQHKRDPRDQ